MHWLTLAFDRAVAFAPDFLAGLAILVFGYLIARVVARVLVPVVHRTGFDRLLSRHGMIERTPESRAGSRGLASAAFWIVMATTLLQTARAWRLTFVARGLARVLAYVPNLAAAAFIIGAGVLFGDWVRGRMRAAEERRTYGSLAPGAVRAGILTLAVFMALRQLLIAPEIVTIAFTLVLGAIALAAALSFGLGGRRVAEQISSDWYGAHGEPRLPPRSPPGREAPPMAPDEPPPAAH